jgi:ribosome maturation factor RimP
MNKEQQSQTIAEMVEQIIADDPTYFLVGVQIRPTHNIKVYLDADGGVSIDRCVSYNRLLYKQIEASEIFPAGEFSLEVSSPGLDEPLKMHRQYLKNIGRSVEVTLLDGSLVSGVLKEANAEQIKVETEKGKGKKKEIELKEIPFGEVKATKILIVF